MKISVSSYSFSQALRAGKITLIECVAKAKEMGFDGIEFIDLPGDSLDAQKTMAAALRAEADRVGIEINAYTIGANLYRDTAEESDAEVQRLCGQLEVAKILGASVMRHDVCYRLGKTGNSRSLPVIYSSISKLS